MAEYAIFLLFLILLGGGGGGGGELKWVTSDNKSLGYHSPH